MSELDEQFMKRALELARRGAGQVSPNPAVGAVLVRDGRVVGEGYFLYEHLKHAEVYALEQAGELARGATLYCSLEPCCFQGRTPPCTDALIAAGIARAVIAVADPHPRVRGRGLDQLRRAGIAVEVGLLEEEAKRLNEAFFKFALVGLPFIHVVTIETVGPTQPAWSPSPEFMQSAMEYDAILLESLSEAALNIVQASLGRHRHRPLIISGGGEVLRKASEMLPAMNDRQNATVFEHAAIDRFGEESVSNQVLEKMLMPLAEMRAIILLALTASSEPSPLVCQADKVTRVVNADHSEDQAQVIAEKLQEIIVTESAGFKELTGYPRPRDEGKG